MRSRKCLLIKGKIAAEDSAAVLYQLIPCLAGAIIGSVFACVLVSRVAKNLSQHKIAARIKVAAMPGRAMDRMILRKALRAEHPSTSAPLFQLIRDVFEGVADKPVNNWQNHQSID